MTRRALTAVDLFAGAGGCSTGLLHAATQRGDRVELVAVNHWPVSVATHTLNHPEARHFCASIETLDPKVAVPGGKLDLLIAAPECVFHSTARGGKPIDDQRRASAWHVLRWLEHLRVEDVLIENVPEFVKWGPLGANNRPLKSKAGEIFRAFIAVIEALNYRVEWKILNAADYGAATTRRRLFIRARLGRKAIVWPEPTHSKTGNATLFRGPKKWRPAREVIDWSLPSQSIFTRKTPLKPATMRRILEGLRRFGGPDIQPFLVQLSHGGRVHDADAPMPTITTAKGGELAVAEPVVMKVTHGDRKRERSVGEPLPTITAANRGELGLIEPFVVQLNGTSDHALHSTAKSIDEPIGAVTASGHFGVAQPFIVQPAHGSGGGRGNAGRVSSIDAPLGVQPATNRFALAEPFLVPLYSEREGQAPRTHSVSDPLPVIPASGDGKFGIVESFILGQQSGSVPRPVSEPAPTVATDGAIGLVEPFLTKYNRTAIKAKSVNDPLETVSTRDRFALVQPVVNGYVLDIKFRMLQPHELSAAMSFPKGYVFTGNKGDQIRQIGNAVDCRMAEALCGAILDTARQPKAAKKTEAVA